LVTVLQWLLLDVMLGTAVLLIILLALLLDCCWHCCWGIGGVVLWALHYVFCTCMLHGYWWQHVAVLLHPTGPGWSVLLHKNCSFCMLTCVVSC
jgi:hypothetical protein